MKNRAFTLIELLVVIGIIALLASIALPAYRGVQERAKGVKDSNNLRQIGVGFLSYLNDHDDTMMTGGAATSGSTSWANVLGPNGSSRYVGDSSVFQSPFDSRPASATNLSYGINNGVINPPTGGNGALISNVTSYTHPSSLFLLGPSESLAGNAVVYADTVNSSTPMKPNSGIVGVMSNRMLLNVLYADWHVATISSAEFNSGTATEWIVNAP